MSKMGNYVVGLMEDGLWDAPDYPEPDIEAYYEEYYKEKLSAFKSALNQVMMIYDCSGFPPSEPCTKSKKRMQNRLIFNRMHIVIEN